MANSKKEISTTSVQMDMLLQRKNEYMYQLANSTQCENTMQILSLIEHLEMNIERLKKFDIELQKMRETDV